MGNFVEKIMFPIRAPRNERISVKTIDEHGIQYLYCRNENSDDILLYSHGNSETLDENFELICTLSQRCDISVLIYEYPDEPTCAKVNDTILNVHDYVFRVLGFSPGNTILMGRSIGTGPTMWLASYLHLELGVSFKGIVLISALSSVHHFLAIKLPFGIGRLLSYFIEERYDNMRAIENIGDTPVLLLHGAQDGILDPLMSQVLYARYKGDTNRCRIQIENCHNHNTIMGDMHILESELLRFFGDIEVMNDNNF